MDWGTILALLFCVEDTNPLGKGIHAGIIRNPRSCNFKGRAGTLKFLEQAHSQAHFSKSDYFDCSSYSRSFGSAWYLLRSSNHQRQVAMNPRVKLRRRNKTMIERIDWVASAKLPISSWLYRFEVWWTCWNAPWWRSNTCVKDSVWRFSLTFQPFPRCITVFRNALIVFITRLPSMSNILMATRSTVYNLGMWSDSNSFHSNFNDFNCPQQRLKH